MKIQKFRKPVNALTTNPAPTQPANPPAPTKSGWEMPIEEFMVMIEGQNEETDFIVELDEAAVNDPKCQSAITRYATAEEALESFISRNDGKRPSRKTKARIASLEKNLNDAYASVAGYLQRHLNSKNDKAAAKSQGHKATTNVGEEVKKATKSATASPLINPNIQYTGTMISGSEASFEDADKVAFNAVISGYIPPAVSSKLLEGAIIKAFITERDGRYEAHNTEIVQEAETTDNVLQALIEAENLDLFTIIPVDHAIKAAKSHDIQGILDAVKELAEDGELTAFGQDPVSGNHVFLIEGADEDGDK